VSLVMEVLRRLDDRGVAYCHWKSNDHLDAALSADTDLDILVDPAGIDALYTVFAELACRRGRVANARNDVGLEDFLGVDDESGSMVHFHVHYRIPGGERHNKRFRIPWERTVLETRVRDESGVWVTAPDVEVVLLLTRYALKLRGRDIARGAHGPDAELAFLMDRTDRDAVLATTRRLLGDRAVPAVADVLAAGPVDAGAVPAAPDRAARARFADQLARSRGLHPPYEPGGRVGDAGDLPQGRAAAGAEGAGRHRWRAPRGLRRLRRLGEVDDGRRDPARSSRRSSTCTRCTSARATARRRSCASR